jgi:hypothetical protein
MKKIIFLLYIIPFSLNAWSQEEKNPFILGVNSMYRHIDNWNSYIYPRLSFEYRLNRMSSFDLMLEYIDYKIEERRNLSYPLSAGYKLNLVPLLTKEETLTDRLRVYGALRYTFLPAAANPNKPFGKFYTFHKIRFAPGIDYFFSPRWGMNVEMVFGQNMKSTAGLGIRYHL